jgi:transposase
MAKRARKRRGRRRPQVLQKPKGIIHPRVQKVGPEHFGIVSVDCAKHRSKWMLADFYGNLLLPPTGVEHNRLSLQAAVERLQQAVAEHELFDVLAAVERTGCYHHPIKRAFAAAGFDTRVVHPFTTKQFRLVADPDIKTDDIDLAAIHRAAVNGFALAEAPRDDSWLQLQLLARHRRDWVQKASTLCCQIKEHLHAALPGYAGCFGKFWENRAALELALHFGDAQALRQAAVAGMTQRLREAGIRFQRRTLDRILAWAEQAADADGAAACRQQIAAALNADRVQKSQQIQALERQIAAGLTRTSYILLLGVPGINVVSAADFAAEAGPPEHYANARSITGRAGLYPRRYQSDQVDHKNGPLAKCANRRLRAALLQIADNLLKCNRHFGRLARQWLAAGADPRLIRVRIASRFSRIAFHMVAGGQVFRHPCARRRDSILEKLLSFHQEHQTPPAQILADLEATRQHVPAAEHAAEAAPLSQRLAELPRKRRPQPLGEILPVVLARWMPRQVECDPSGEPDPT